jgi:YbbR domain-containing protein
MKNNKKKIRKILLKLTSVIVAVFLWVYVIGSSEIELEKPITVKWLTPAGKVISNHVVHELVYTVKGPRAILRDFSEQEIRYIVELENIKPKKNNVYDIYFNLSNLKLPFGVNVLKVTPGYQQVLLEKEIKKKLKVVPKIASSELNGKKVTIVDVFPHDVNVSGPKTLLQNLKLIHTLPIEASNLESIGEISVPLSVPDDRIQWLETDQVVIKYKLDTDK